MTKTMEIIELGDVRLRKKADLVKNFSDPALQSLIDELLVTVEEANGVGIAAPQVGQSIQLFIIASKPSKRYPHAPQMDAFPLINPVIESSGGVIQKDWEGCLSVPGIRGLVPRNTEISIRYQDRQGLIHRQVLHDFVARIFQHELDHLHGQVFLDHVESTLDMMTEKEYQNQIVNP